MRRYSVWFSDQRFAGAVKNDNYCKCQWENPKKSIHFGNGARAVKQEMRTKVGLWFDIPEDMKVAYRTMDLSDLPS